jgi:hypothetical protein
MRESHEIGSSTNVSNSNRRYAVKIGKRSRHEKKFYLHAFRVELLSDFREEVPDIRRHGWRNLLELRSIGNVRVCIQVLESLVSIVLNPARLLNLTLHSHRSVSIVINGSDVERGHQDLQVNTIEKRLAKLLAIGIYLRPRTVALRYRSLAWMLRATRRPGYQRCRARRALPVEMPAAMARIHCRAENESTRELNCSVLPLHDVCPVVQRVPQLLNQAAVAQVDLIEEKHSMMRKRDFTRSDVPRSASEQRGRGHACVPLMKFGPPFVSEYVE